MNRLVAVMAIAGLCAAATANPAFTVTFTELQTIQGSPSSSWYTDVINYGGFSVDQFQFETTGGDWSALDWVRVELPAGAYWDTAPGGVGHSNYGTWLVPGSGANFNWSGLTSNSVQFKYDGGLGSTFSLFVDVDNSTPLVRGGALGSNGSTNFENHGAKFVVSYAGVQYSAGFTGINAQSAYATVALPDQTPIHHNPAPGAALLGFVGLVTVGWARRRLS